MVMQPQTPQTQFDVEPLVVADTGFAFLRQGEIVVPVPGSEALLTSIREGGGLVLEFPVEVEVRLVNACDPEEHADVALQRLLHALEGLG